MSDGYGKVGKVRNELVKCESGWSSFAEMEAKGIVAFLDMEKAYDRVNRKKLFEVMRCYGREFSKTD